MATDHDFKIKNGLQVENGFLLIGKEAFSSSDGYMGIKTSNMSGVNDYMMISGTGDNGTYVSAKSGASVYIRGGGNASAHQLRISSSNAQFYGNLQIDGNLTVNGTTLTVDTTNLQVQDNNITLNYGTGNTVSTANGAGITIQDAMAENHDATILWDTSNDRFNFSDPVNIDIVGPNNTPSADALTVAGYGIIGNRSANVYITNSNSSGGVQIGVGGAHNANPKLTVSSSAATFTVPVTSTYFLASGGDSTPAGTTFSNVFKGSNQRTVYFDSGDGSAISTWYGSGNTPFAAIDANNGVLRLYVNNTSGSWNERIQMNSSGITHYGTTTVIANNVHLDSTGSAYYRADGATNSWKYLSLQTNGSTNWDIATKNDDLSGALQFRPSGGPTNRTYMDTSGNWVFNGRLTNTDTGEGQKVVLNFDTGGNMILGHDGSYGNSGNGRYITLGFGGTTNGVNRIFAHNNGEDGLYLAAATGKKVKVRANGASSDTFALGIDDTYSGYASLGFGGGLQNGYNRIFASTGSNDGIYIAAATGRQISFRVNGQGTDAFKMDSSGRFVVGSTIVLDQSRNLTNIGTITNSGKISSSIGSNATYSRPLLEITSSATPTQIKITTNIPYSGSGASTHAHSVRISGFQYGSAQMADLQIGWHVYLNQFYNRSVTSSGSWAPTVTLAVENNKVVIHLASPGYWPKLYVESMYNAYGGAGQASGWSWSDAAISADANTPNQTVPYKFDYGNGVLNSAGTTVIDASRNLTNIGTISSGAITSSGAISAGAVSTFSGGSSDYAATFSSTDAYSGIRFQDPDGVGVIYYRGAVDHLYLNSSTFSVGGSTLATNYEFQVNGDANITGNLALNGTSVIDSTSFRGRAYLRHVNSNIAVQMDNNTYTMFKNPLGETRLWLGSSGYSGASSDTNNYYNGSTHFFRDTGSNESARISGLGVDAKSGGFLINGTSVINSSRVVQNVTLGHSTTGARFETNDWMYDTGNKARFYFEGGGRTFFGSDNGYVYRDSSDVGRATISNYGGANLLSGGDGQVGSTVALAVGGTTTIDSSRNVFGVNGSFTGKVDIGGSAIGTRSTSLTVNNGDDSSPIAAKSSSATVWSILPWSSGRTYIGSGIYYDDGSWVHASADTTNCLFAIAGSGVSWYSSDNSSGSWNIASDVDLWDSTGTWVGEVDTGSSVDAASGFYVNGTAVIDNGRKLTNITGGYFTGNVGIRVNNPDSALAVRGTGTGASQKNTISFGTSGWGNPAATNAALDGGVKLALFEGSTQKVQIGMDGNARLWFSSTGSGTEGIDFYTGSSDTVAPSLRMRIDKNGVVGINKTSMDSSYRLDIAGHIKMNNNHIHYTNELHFHSNTRFVNSTAQELKLRAGGSSVGLRFQHSGGDSTRGYVWGNNEGGNSIGFLDSGGNWGVRHINDQGTVFYADGATQQAAIGADLVSGSFGSMVVNEAKSGWLGYSINNRVVFMHDNSNSSGIYNDVNNHWMVKTINGGAAELYHNGSQKFQTTGSGVTVTGNVTHDGLTMTSGTDIDQLYTVTDSLTITTSWQNTSINYNDLSTGTYIIQVYVHDHGNGGAHYNEYYSGMMSWYAGTTNSTEFDELALHRAGHAPNDKIIFLRTLRTASNASPNVVLQIRGNYTRTAAANYVFKLRRMI